MPWLYRIHDATGARRLQIPIQGCIALLSGCLLLTASAASALELPGAWNDPDRLSVRGFGTLGAVYNTQDDIRPQRDFGQPDTFGGRWSWRMDSLLGVQIDARLTDTLDAAAQLVLKKRATDTFAQSLEFAFLGWHPTAGLDLRFGRLPADFYMLADYRNVGFAYLWQRPPVEFYGPLILHSFDGIDVGYRVPFATGTLVAKIFGGRSVQHLEFNRMTGADTLEMAPLWGFRLSHETERWRLNAGFLRLVFANDPNTLGASGLLDGLRNPLIQRLWPAARHYADTLPSDGRAIAFHALGAEYDDNLWLIAGELGYLNSSWSPVPDTLSAYLSLGRRFGTLTPYLLLAIAQPLEERAAILPPAPLVLAQPEVAALYQGTRRFQDGPYMDQRGVGLGVRWDLGRKLALKAQWDHVVWNRSEIAAGGGLWWLWNHERQGGRHVDLLSLSLNWMF